MAKEPLKVCNFCRRPRNEVGTLAAAPDGTQICNFCTKEIHKLILDEEQKSATDSRALKKPREITSILNQSVIGQDDAKREMAIAVYEHYRRRECKGVLTLDGEGVEIDKSNILLMGPSGTGKTHIARAIARMLDVPFYVADCTKLTTAGYVGDDVESVLQGLIADAKQNLDQAQWGIVFLDEFDKLARKSGRSASGFRDVTGEGVQQSLLKLLEGSQVGVPRGTSKNVSGLSTSDTLDTTNILFVAAGSFAGIEEVVERRLNKSSGLGFGREPVEKNRTKTSVYRNVTVEDLEDFGLIPEIVGRLPVVTSTYELTEDELIRILIEPKNAICKQFRALFALDGIDLQFDPDALVAIAKKAIEHSTGARALRYVVKMVLKPYSFEVPDNSDIAAIRITSAAVESPGSAVIVRKTVGHG